MTNVDHYSRNEIHGVNDDNKKENYFSHNDENNWDEACNGKGHVNSMDNEDASMTTTTTATANKPNSKQWLGNEEEASFTFRCLIWVAERQAKREPDRPDRPNGKSSTSSCWSKAGNEGRQSGHEPIDEALCRRFSIHLYLAFLRKEKGHSTLAHAVEKRRQVVLKSPISLITKHFMRWTKKGRTMVETTPHFSQYLPQILAHLHFPLN